LTAGTTYHFAVMSRNAAGNLATSSDNTFQTLPSPPVSYTIKASAGSGGTITPSGTVSVGQGTSQTFDIVPKTGYSIGNVLADGSSVGAVPSYTFGDVTSTHTITAIFSPSLPGESGGSSSQTLPSPPVSYTIKASARSGGTITPSGTVSVAQGASQTFDIVPRIGYSIGDVLADGSSVGAVPSCTFSDVTSNHTITASFTRNWPGRTGGRLRWW